LTDEDNEGIPIFETTPHKYSAEAMLQEDMYITRKICSAYHINITKSATSLKHPDDNKKDSIREQALQMLH